MGGSCEGVPNGEGRVQRAEMSGEADKRVKGVVILEEAVGSRSRSFDTLHVVIAVVSIA